MKNNIDDLGKTVKKACDDLDLAGGIHECSDEDWQAFTVDMNEELARSQTYVDEMNDIIRMINPNKKSDEN